MCVAPLHTVEDAELDVGPLCLTAATKHPSLLASYLLNLRLGPPAIRKLVLADLRRFRDLGARQRASDLWIVPRLLHDEHHEDGWARSSSGDLAPSIDI